MNNTNLPDKKNLDENALPFNEILPLLRDDNKTWVLKHAEGFEFLTDGNTVCISDFDLLNEEFLKAPHKVLHIPQTLDGKPVTTILSMAFHCSDDGNSPDDSIYDEVESVIIPEGVTCVQDFAFCGLKNVTSISIPDSLISIGTHFFADILDSRKNHFENISVGKNNPVYHCENNRLIETATDNVIL